MMVVDYYGNVVSGLTLLKSLFFYPFATGPVLPRVDAQF